MPDALTIPSRDGFLLSAMLFQPTAPKACVQINSATGTKKEFYINFATYLTEQGYAVVIFDYRGIGGSRPESLRGFKAFNHEWGMKDMAAVLDWFDARFPGLPKFMVGHSAGGQQMGFMDNHKKIAKAYLVSCSTGYWRWLSSPYKYFSLFVWYVLAPVMNATLGYVAASKFGLGEDLPKGVANEWRTWCLNRNYFRDYLDTTLKPNFFDQFSAPIHFIYPEDDTIATDKTVASLRNFYPATATTVEKVILTNYGLKGLGHFGFFSRKVKEIMWPKAVRFFEDR